MLHDGKAICLRPPGHEVRFPDWVWRTPDGVIVSLPAVAVRATESAVSGVYEAEPDEVLRIAKELRAHIHYPPVSHETTTGASQ